MKQKVERQVFEQSKSYTHGVQNDLGKYFKEYQELKQAGNTGSIYAMESVINMRFSDVDPSSLSNPAVGEWLVMMRGY